MSRNNYSRYDLYMILYTYPTSKHVITARSGSNNNNRIITIGSKTILQATYHYNIIIFYCLYRPPLIAALSTAMKKNRRGLLKGAHFEMDQDKPLELIVCDKRMNMLQWVRSYFFPTLSSSHFQGTIMFNIRILLVTSIQGQFKFKYFNIIS